jgi:hypothetical protein
MNVTPAIASVAHAGLRAEASIMLPDSREFASRLSIGQIIKGRVLLQYEGTRYLVAFEGGERTVDSSIPFRTGDILHGKVVALGDRVELQYLPEGRQPASMSTGVEAREPVTSPPPLNELDALLLRYQAKLSADGREILLRAIRSAANREWTALAGVMLAKLQLPQDTRLLASIAAGLARNPANEAAEPRDATLVPLAGPAVTRQLRELVKQALRESGGPDGAAIESSGAAPDSHQPSIPDTGLGKSPGERRDSRFAGLAASVLNAQGGGSVAHRVGTLPLIVGDRLIEVDVAVFDQEQGRQAQSGTRHRALVFVLNLTRLGRVEISASVVEDRVRVRIGADRPESVEWLSQHGAGLREALVEAGWAVDEIGYGDAGADAGNPAVRSVVEHVIAQDSLNRLV